MKENSAIFKLESLLAFLLIVQSPGREASLIIHFFLNTFVAVTAVTEIHRNILFVTHANTLLNLSKMTNPYICTQMRAF